MAFAQKEYVKATDYHSRAIGQFISLMLGLQFFLTHRTSAVP
jgi:hypothetical protein